MSLQLCFSPERIVKSMNENENTDFMEASLLHQMDTWKLSSVPTHLTLHRWTVLLLFKVKVNFRIKKKVKRFKGRMTNILISIIF